MMLSPGDLQQMSSTVVGRDTRSVPLQSFLACSVFVYGDLLNKGAVLFSIVFQCPTALSISSITAMLAEHAGM